MGTLHGDLARLLHPELADKLAREINQKCVTRKHPHSYISLNLHGYKTHFPSIANGTFFKIGVRSVHIPQANGMRDKLIHLVISQDVIPPTFLTHSAENANVIKTVLIDKEANIFREYHSQMEYFKVQFEPPQLNIQLRCVDGENNIMDVKGEVMLEMITMV